MFLESLLIFTGIMLGIFTFLFTRTAIKIGSFKGMIEYYKKNREYRDWLPLLYIPAIIMFVFFLMTPKAEAVEPVRYLDYTSIHAGLEIPLGDKSIFCRDGQTDSVDDRLTSNLGMHQHIVGWHGIDIVGTYTHHSCAIDRDQDVYDAFGVQLVWTHHW